MIAGDTVSIYFKTEEAPPYHILGQYIHEDDEYVVLKGTVGNQIGHTLLVPKREIKLIEVI